jgi:hypothetical protein
VHHCTLGRVSAQRKVEGMYSEGSGSAVKKSLGTWPSLGFLAPTDVDEAIPEMNDILPLFFLLYTGTHHGLSATADVTTC